jgi:hypothetical protein
MSKLQYFSIILILIAICGFVLIGGVFSKSEPKTFAPAAAAPHTAERYMIFDAFDVKDNIATLKNETVFETLATAQEYARLNYQDADGVNAYDIRKVTINDPPETK